MLSGDSDERALPPLLTSAREKAKTMLEQQLVRPPFGEETPFA